MMFLTIGMLLTLGDAGVGKLDVLGPVAVENFLRSTKNFTRPIENYFPPKVDMSLNIAPYVTKDLTTYPIALQIESGIENVREFCYIGQTTPVAGKFYIEKATELGVPKGPLFAKLKNGQSITLENGTVILSSQVTGDPIPSQFFSIICRIHVSNESSLQSLIRHSHWQRY
jgi:ribonuclease Z